MKRFFNANLVGALLVAFVLTSLSVFADVKEMKIKTNASCKDCKAKIESVLQKSDGVSYASVDLKKNVVAVKYDTDKTNPEKVRQTIADAGYVADKVKPAKASGCCTTGSKSKGSCDPKKCTGKCEADKK